MQIGIEIKGKDYCAVGMGEDQADKCMDERINYVESFDLVGGGTFFGPGNNDEHEFTCGRIDRKDVGIAMYKKFMRGYRKKFPTFDGHIKLTDIDHATRDEQRMIDAFMQM